MDGWADRQMVNVKTVYLLFAGGGGRGGGRGIIRYKLIRVLKFWITEFVWLFRSKQGHCSNGFPDYSLFQAFRNGGKQIFTAQAFNMRFKPFRSHYLFIQPRQLPLWLTKLWTSSGIIAIAAEQSRTALLRCLMTSSDVEYGELCYAIWCRVRWVMLTGLMTHLLTMALNKWVAKMTFSNVDLLIF